MQEEREIKGNVETKDVEVGANETETTKVEEKTQNVSDSVQKTEEKETNEMEKPTKRTKTPKKKEVKVMESEYEKSKKILGQVCNKFKDCTLSPTKTGLRIKRGGDIICTANLHECKITIPVQGDGLKVWHDNQHMTRIPHGHKDLAKLFEMRCKDKRTNREVIDDVYGKGAVTPGHARLRGKAAPTAEELEAKAKELKAQAATLRKAERKDKATEKARKAKKVAKATA